MNWGAEAIWEAVVPSLAGFSVEILTEIDSTNSELMRRARRGQLDPILLVAERQTAGRGRLGRTWHSDDSHVGAGQFPDGPSLGKLAPSGGSAVREATSVGAGQIPDGPALGATMPALTFSLGLVLSPQNWSGLSLAVGLGVAQSLHADLRLKWPNDIWLADRKLAGILIETALFGDQRYAVIGIGINIAPRSAAGLATAPAWLQEVQPGIDAALALQRVALPLVQTLQKFEQTGFAPWQADFNARDLLAGRDVVLSEGTQGRALGVDADGALRVQTDSGIKLVNSSEVSVRPLTANSPLSVRTG